jgi:hypothetical protein
MVGKFITAILCLAVVSFALINFGGKLEVEREEAIETVALGSLALRDKLAEFSKPENPDSHFSSLRLDLPANSKSEIEIQAFDGHVDVIGSVAFLNANGEQVLLPRKFLADIRINSVSDEEGWYRQRGHDPEPLIARSIKWQLSLLGEEADKERFEIQKKWIRGACWVSNATSNEVPSFDTSEPGLVTTRKVWIAKRNLYPWQRFSKIDACLEDRNIAELPPDPAFVDLVSADGMLSVSFTSHLCD